MRFLFFLTGLFFSYQQVIACTTIIVGSKASEDGSVIIARNVDQQGLAAQHFVVHKNKKNEKGSKFHSLANNFSYPLPHTSLKYTGTPMWYTNNTSFEEAGINELNVAVSATETIHNSTLGLKFDPYQANTGINEDSIASVLLPRIQSSKEGVQLLGHIIETQGAAEGFGVAIADKKHAWYLETASGHQWVAIRIPDNQCLVAANQSRIQQINLNNSSEYLSSPNLVSFSKAHHLTNSQNNTFNCRNAYAELTPHDSQLNYPRLARLFKLYSSNVTYNQKKGLFPTLFSPRKPLKILDIIHGLQDYQQNTSHDPYITQNPDEKWRPISVFKTLQSHIISINKNRLPSIRGIQYLAMGMSSFSLYVPFFTGLSSTPAEYQKGNNTSDDKSAYWTYRKMQTLVMMNFPKYAPSVHQLLEQKQKSLIEKTESFLRKYQKHPNINLINSFSSKLSQESLKTAKSITNAIFTKLALNIDETYQFSDNVAKMSACNDPTSLYKLSR